MPKKAEAAETTAKKTTKKKTPKKTETTKSFNNKKGSIRISPDKPQKRMSEEKLAAATLLNSKTQKQPLEVTVTGIEPVKPNASAPAVMMPVCMYHGWKIIIPRDQFIPAASIRPEDIQTEEDLTKRIFRYNSAKIDIIPTNFYPSIQACIASRILGMQKKCEEMWFAVNKKNGTSDYLIQPGSKVEARIVNVVRGAVFIEVFGVESVVLAQEVAWYRIDNCRNKYKSGDTTFVIIEEVKRDEELKTVSYKASIKKAYSDPRKNAFTRYVRGGVYEGRVTMINTDPEKTEQSGAFVRLGRDEEDKIDVYCKYPKGVNPEIGDTVTVGISDKDPEALRIWGNILHIDRQTDN